MELVGTDEIPAAKMPFHKPQQSNVMTAFKDIIGGTLGGMGLVAVGHPFDTMKVRLQTQSLSNPTYNGLIDCARKTMGREGIKGFYQGVLSPLSGQMFLNATQFFAWGQSVALVHYQTKRTQETFTILDFAFCGILTGVSCALVESPIDFFKSQLQTQIFKKNPLYTTVPQAVKLVLKTYGIRGAYQGLSATIIRNLPFRSLYFGTYELMRKVLLTESEVRNKDGTLVPRSQIPSWKLLVSGGTAGLSQWFFCYPLDVIKSSMQADNIDRKQRKYRGWIDCVRKLYAEGGTKMFFRGFTPCMLRSFPANAVCFFLYEKAQEVMHDW